MNPLAPRVELQRLWSDEDLAWLTWTMCNGESLFTTHFWASHHDVDGMVQSLELFRTALHQGRWSYHVGGFGTEFAGGALSLEMHTMERGLIVLSARAESESREVAGRRLASEASMYFVTEPGLLDRFVGELAAAAKGKGGTAVLELRGD
jgi:hypothetical protein